MYPIGSCFIVTGDVGPIGFNFIVLLCSMPFSRFIAYSYASCGVLVSANNSSAVFALFMCAVNIPRTHSSSLSSLSARKASSTRSAWNFSSVPFFLRSRLIKLYLSNANSLCDKNDFQHLF